MTLIFVPPNIAQLMIWNPVISRISRFLESKLVLLADVVQSFTIGFLEFVFLSYVFETADQSAIYWSFFGNVSVQMTNNCTDISEYLHISNLLLRNDRGG